MIFLFLAASAVAIAIYDHDVFTFIRRAQFQAFRGRRL